ncbi:MAG: WecB/TagA/CpsF family glycosyltransferase [Leptospiraceae bacterium]|nr:WecB/TagA/CpsF family glycosyltransferase [Leptospiraceae bacterium]MDW7976950.1 WecB/TagA/CpsF family glycosyltransferase [Leptospiraceae bacterium]
MKNPTFLWEDRDILLEYKSIDVSKAQRISLLNVPIDNVSHDEAMAKLFSFLEKKDKVRLVMFIDPIKFIKIRNKKKYQPFMESDLILAESENLQWGAKKLGKELKQRIHKISFLMDVFRLAQKADFTIYLLGSKIENVEKIYTNLTRNLPGIRIVGKQSGNFDKEWETKIKESIKKTSPDIILIGMNFPKQEIWIRQNLQIFTYKDKVKIGNKTIEKLKHSVVIGVDEAFDILSGKKRIPEFFQKHGKEWIWRIIKHPYRLDWIFCAIQYYFLIWWNSFLIHRKNRK